ncbi:MAG: hypothetical protein GX568_00205 [Candidatus Gastranaerophilales bacterium]|jgi:fumarate hydratase class II|nr:hypothetical protein [Candidatus Gastranaerophilales bacterium]
MPIPSVQLRQMQAQSASMSFKGTPANPAKTVVKAAKTAKTANANSNKMSLASLLWENTKRMGEAINKLFEHIANTSKGTGF